MKIRSLFREAFPRELFEKLKQSGRRVEERSPGIYYVTGNLLFDTQIVVTKDLSKKAHRYLKLLSKNVKEQDVRELIQACCRHHGDRHNVAAVLEVIFAVDRKLRKAIEEDNAIGEILDEMLKDRIDAKLTEQAKKAAIVKYENDTPLSVIATAFDVPVATVQKWLVQHCANNGEYSTCYLRQYKGLIQSLCCRQSTIPPYCLLPPPCPDTNIRHCFSPLFRQCCTRACSCIREIVARQHGGDIVISRSIPENTIYRIKKIVPILYHFCTTHA